MVDIPGFANLEPIHEGAKSLVYRAERESDHGRRVLKLLRGDYPPKESVSRFQREFQLLTELNRLDCPRTIVAHEIIPVGHSFCMVLEDFGATSLGRVRDGHKLRIADFLRIATSATEAVRELHRQNVVHKNINPSNIVWNPSTASLRLVGFSLASQMTSETVFASETTAIGSDLAYISPEQSGRMNRSVDYRSDIYSLGLSFYELLCGRTAFVSEDPNELVHAHMAKEAPDMTVVNPAIPRMLQKIVMKMIEKNAEDRYQTAEGIIEDLGEFRARMGKRGSDQSFAIAAKDKSARFHIPEKLYGREEEIAALGSIFDRVAAGGAAIVMCTGGPGFGKSALIQEMYKPVVGGRGYFIQGKYDEFQRNVPYSAISQAFGGLVRQILAENEEDVREWRHLLLKSLGANAEVITNIIPELNLLLGPQSPSQALGIVETQNRFAFVFQNFLDAIASQRRPLVIFIDDLQWADNASLRLLRILTTNFGNHHVLFAGAYRDDEIPAGHPLLAVLREITEIPIRIHEIKARALSFEQVDTMVSDTLHCDRTDAAELAELILKKTQGNAFFVRQFFKSLYDENLIRFDRERPGWVWDRESLFAQDVTENVVSLMTKRLRKLESATQRVLSSAACLGKKFDLTTLAIVSQQSANQTMKALWPALHSGFVSALDNRYQLVGRDENEVFKLRSEFGFVHSKVQQAAYGLLEAPERPEIHLAIGRLLLASTPDGVLDIKLFDIVNHMNRGSEMLSEAADRRRLAVLNLRAGRRAKTSTAYAAALIYFSMGRELLPPDSWEHDYELTLSLSVEQAQCDYLVGDVEKAKTAFNLILEKARGNFEKAKVLNVMMVINFSLDRFEESVEYGRRGLALLGMKLPSSAQMTRLRLMIEYARLQIFLFGRTAGNIANHKKLTSPESLLIVELAVNMGIAALQHGAGRLYGVLCLYMMRRSLTHGNSNRSSTIYLGYALLVSFAATDYKKALEFGKLGLRIADAYKDSAADAVNLILWTWISHWNGHLREGLAHLKSAYEKSMESGNHFFAAFGMCNYIIAQVYTGTELGSVARTLEEFRPFLGKNRTPYGTALLHLYTRYLAVHRGEGESGWSLDGGGFDEVEWTKPQIEGGNYPVLARFMLCKQELAYFSGDYVEALRLTAELKPLMRVQMKSYFGYPFMFLYHNLSLSARYPSLPPAERAKTLKTLVKQQNRLRYWARLCPQNYELMAALSAGELARIRGRDSEAIRYYERAIEAAHENGYIQFEALANELAARFYEGHGQSRIASAYLAEAHYLYDRWGAIRKTSDLERAYPFLGDNTSPRGKPLAGPLAETTGLDFAAVLKASQTIAGEIRFEPLLVELMKVVIENSGAARGVLLLNRRNEWYVEAELDLSREHLRKRASKTLAAARDIPQALIAYVLRTQETVVQGDSPAQEILAHDPYFIVKKPRSLLCMPLVGQNKLTGILYLENAAVGSVFNGARLELLRLLSGQIAVSIENAQLFESLQNSMDTQVKLVDKLLRSERLATIGTISAEVAHEINNPNHLVLINASTLQQNLAWLSAVVKEVVPAAGIDPLELVNAGGQNVEEVLKSIPPAIEETLAASLRIATIVSGLKDQAKADPSTWIECDLRDIVRDAVRFNKHVIEAATETWRLDLPHVPVPTRAAPLRLSQVLGNLIQNAANALTDRKQSISIVLGTGEKAGQAEITVSDEGRGIDPKDLPRIGEAFFSTRRQHGGSGLGIMIAKRIVAEHSGTLSIDSKKGAGTTVRVILPTAGPKA